jgi:hypothetical protein
MLCNSPAINPPEHTGVTGTVRADLVAYWMGNRERLPFQRQVQTDQHQKDCAQHTRKGGEWGFYIKIAGFT